MFGRFSTLYQDLNPPSENGIALHGFRLPTMLVQIKIVINFVKPVRRIVMSVRVRVPTPLRKFTQGADEVDAQGNTIRSIVEDLEKNYPGIKERICDETGKVRRFVNVYVNGDDIRFLQNLETALKEGDNISIVPAIAGGA
jgi:molybdopterin synthase sulfur carrier subunit